VTHYRVIQERWSPIWPHSERMIERLDTEDKREAEAFYKALCQAAAEVRRLTRDRADGLELLAEVERRTIPAEAMLEGFRAYSGRLTWQDGQLDYTPGQYAPTERREAACAVLKAMLWNYWRADLPPEVENRGAALRSQAKIALRPALYRRWFA